MGDAAEDIISSLAAYRIDGEAGVPMSRCTTFRAGGRAAYFVTVKNAPAYGTEQSELEAALRLAKERGLPYFLLGNGSNLLVSDAGYDGMIVRLGRGYDRLERDGQTITAGAAVPLARLSAYAIEQGLAGLEFASGIPGTLGGGIVMNAGAYGGELAQVVSAAEIYFPREGKVRSIPAEELHFGYRHSLLKETEGIVLSVTLHLQAGRKSDMVETVSRLRAQRMEKQPLEYASAGSTFKRPEGAYAGKLIQDAGLAGYRIGDAQVSEKHCGFIINRGSATATELYRLIREVQKKVKEASGYTLETEVILLGDFG